MDHCVHTMPLLESMHFKIALPVICAGQDRAEVKGDADQVIISFMKFKLIMSRALHTIIIQFTLNEKIIIKIH